MARNSKKQKSIFGSESNNISGLELASALKNSNKNIDYFLDIIIFMLSSIWMFYAYMLTINPSMKLFTIINIGLTIIAKALIHLNFYNLLFKNKKSKNLKILGFFMIVFIFLSFALWMFLFTIVYKNTDTHSLQSMVKSFSGLYTLVTGIILVILGIADKTVWTFVDGRRGKAVN